MKDFRLLNPDEIECRVSRITEKGVVLLLYKTARTDADILDETVGSASWMNDFKLVDGVLYGGIGIYDPHRGEWVWKWDAGTESNTEAEKGRASDAFKRAGFKWGIGRELYSSPFVFIPSGKCDIKDVNGRKVCNDQFDVAEIGYDTKERVSRLVITLRDTIVFEWGEPTPSNAPICECCGKPIYDQKKRNGERWAAADIAVYTKGRYGKALCAACAKEAKDAGQTP